MKMVYEVYYYAGGEELTLGYYFIKNKAKERVNEWSILSPCIRELEVEE